MNLRFPSIVICSLLAACASSAAPPESSSAPASAARTPDLAARFPMPRSRLEIDATGDGVSLESVLQRLSQSTGVVFSYNAQTQGLLHQSVVRLSAPASIEPPHAYPWVETLLVQHGFLLGSPTNAEPPIVEVMSHGPGGASMALSIDSKELEFCRAHPAVLVSTTLQLPHVDVRTLGNSLRGIAGDAPFAGIMPIGNTSSLVLTGSGGWVADTADLLQRVDDAAANGKDVRAAIADEGAKSGR